MTRFLLLLLIAGAMWAQPFSSGSTGADGALNLVTPGTVVFDPAALNIDTDGDNVFNFTTINIRPGVTVQLLNGLLRGKSVVWLASGAVTIAGTIDLGGQAGYPTNPPPLTGRFPSAPGPGGYQGGMGTDGGSASGGFFTGVESGRGPGGGGPCGGGAAYANNGALGAQSYGNAALVPLRGGSGGAGGCLASAKAGGGGAGGGALRIESTVSITLTGSILANGGDGGGASGQPSENGGGGSGGGIHLIAPSISGAGTLRALGGAAFTQVYAGSVGRIRLDATTQSFTGSSIPTASFGLPYAVPLPSGISAIRVLSVAGISVPANPTGSFTVPDLVFNQPGQVPVVVEARNIPLNTSVQLLLISEGNLDRAVLSTPPLVGTVALSTTTIQTFIPPGYSRGYVRATF